MEIVDNINHPKHYEEAGYLVQPIDVCQELPFCLGNAVKYLCRAGAKEGSPFEEDLKKAKWYLERQGTLVGLSSGCVVHLSFRASGAARFLCEKKVIRPLRVLFQGVYENPSGFGVSITTEGMAACIKAIDQVLDPRTTRNAKEEPQDWCSACEMILE